MNSMRRIILVNIILFIVLIGGGLAVAYYYNQNVNYLSTDNAAISGQDIPIASPASGKLIDWSAETGKRYNAGDVLGTVQVAATDAKGGPITHNMDITLPQDGTIVQQNAVQNSFVGAGIPLGHAYNFNNLWVTANIKETNLNDIGVGDAVDIYVDAYPGTTLDGTLQSIGLYTANTFSILPTSNTSGNYTKVTQVIPVKITLKNTKGLQLVPGMNVSVRIHK